MSSWNKIKVQSNPVEHIEDVKTDIPEYVDEVDVTNDEEQVEDDSNNEEKDIIPEVEDVMEEENEVVVEEEPKKKFYLFNSCVCNEQLGSFEDEQPDMFEQKNYKIVQSQIDDKKKLLMP